MFDINSVKLRHSYLLQYTKYYTCLYGIYVCCYCNHKRSQNFIHIKYLHYSKYPLYMLLQILFCSNSYRSMHSWSWLQCKTFVINLASCSDEYNLDWTIQPLFMQCIIMGDREPPWCLPSNGKKRQAMIYLPCTIWDIMNNLLKLGCTFSRNGLHLLSTATSSSARRFVVIQLGKRTYKYTWCLTLQMKVHNTIKAHTFNWVMINQVIGKDDHTTPIKLYN